MRKQARLPFAKGGAPRARRSYAHFADRIFGTPLAIHPLKLAAILRAIGPRVLGVEEVTVRIDSDGDDDGDAMSLAGARDGLQIVDGIAVIDVMGSLVHRGGWMNAMSGLTAYEDISSELAQAVADPRVEGILLRLDSPGGEVSGAFDLADAVCAARDAKPICAIAEDMACSAAYAIGSAASMFYASQAAIVGSIGVVMAHVDETKANDQAGLKITQFHAGARKIDLSPDSPLTPESVAAIQATIDATYGVFVSAVARNRGMSADAVRATEAGIYVGAAAKSAGLADEIGTFADAMAWLKGQTAEESTPGAVPMPMKQAPPMPPMPGPYGLSTTSNTADTASGATAAFPEPDEEADMDLKEAMAALEAANKINAELKAENEKLKIRLEAEAEAKAAAVKAVEDGKKEETLQAHVRRGAVLPAQVAAMRKLASVSTSDEFEKELAAMPVLIHKDRVGATPDPKTDAKAEGETPYAKLKALASKKVSENPKLSAPAAFALACEENPALYAEHRAAHRAAHTRQ